MYNKQASACGSVGNKSVQAFCIISKSSYCIHKKLTVGNWNVSLFMMLYIISALQEKESSLIPLQIALEMGLNKIENVILLKFMCTVYFYIIVVTVPLSLFFLIQRVLIILSLNWSLIWCNQWWWRLGCCMQKSWKISTWRILYM